jgi:hypothetical protein
VALALCALNKNEIDMGCLKRLTQVCDVATVRERHMGNVCVCQVTALALCKLNKNEMYMGRLSRRARHERTDDLFWRYDEVPEEALQILQVGHCSCGERQKVEVHCSPAP